MQIRRAEATDEAALARIRRNAILALAVSALSVEEAKTWATGIAPDRIARAILEHDVWVACAPEALGWVEIDRDRIAALYVAPSCARQGIGARLLTRAENLIGRAGYATVHLESSPNALAFYLRRGYVRSGPLDAHGAYPLRKALAALSL